LAALPFTRLLHLWPGRSLSRCRFRFRLPWRDFRLSLVPLVARRGTIGLVWRQGDLGAIAQPVGAVDDDAFTGLQPGQDRNALAVARTELHLRNRHGILRTDHVDERPGGAALDRRDWHDIRVLHRVDAEPDI